MNFRIVLILMFALIVAPLILGEQNVSVEQALDSLESSREIIADMEENGLPIFYVSDLLIEAELILEQLSYASILSNPNSSYSEKREAENFLKFVEWEDLNYTQILLTEDLIFERRDEAFLLLDQLNVERSRIEEETLEYVKDILSEATIAFYEDRFEDFEILLDQFREAFEKEKIRVFGLTNIFRNAKNFFQRYWFPLIIVLIISGFLGNFIFKKYTQKRTEKKINSMIVEKNALLKLIKKNQTERFKENKISGLIYDIRMKKYSERLERIKQQLPVLEASLRRSKQKTKKNKATPNPREKAKRK